MSSPKNLQKVFSNSPLRPYEQNSNFETGKKLNFETEKNSEFEIENILPRSKSVTNKNSHMNDTNDYDNDTNYNDDKVVNSYYSNNDNKDIKNNKYHDIMRPYTADRHRILNNPSKYVSTRPLTAGSKISINNHNYDDNKSNDNYKNNHNEKLGSLAYDDDNDKKNKNTSDVLFSNNHSTYGSTNDIKYSKNKEKINDIQENSNDTSTYVSTNDYKALANTLVSKNEGAYVCIYMCMYINVCRKARRFTYTFIYHI